MSAKQKYLLSVCVDFSSDLNYGWFDASRLEKLFCFYRDMGMTRVYWIYSLRWEEGLLDCLPINRAVPGNARETYERLGEFLPAAVQTAHKLGMELFAVYKPFDLGFYSAFPADTPLGRQYGKLDSLTGRLYFVSKSLRENASMRLARHPNDLADASGATVKTIKLTFDTEQQSLFDRDDLSILVSDDNVDYRPYAEDYGFRVAVEKDNLVIVLDNLKISAPYIALQSHLSPNAGFFQNTLEKLVALLDPKGRRVPFTYGLSPRFGHWKNEWGKDNANGFLFGYNGSAVFDGFQKTARHAIDNADNNGFTAFAISKEKFIHGALSPAYPEVRALWLKHLSECLDAGVDGIDLRPENHNRSMEWERYGFEQPTREAYQRLYGADIHKETFDRAKHRKTLGGFYTLFYREAAQLIRGKRKVVQIHIGRHVQGRAPFRRYMNFYWEWEKWLKEGLADAITLKDSPFVDLPRWERVAALAVPRNIPAYYCPYWNSVHKRRDWQKKWAETLDISLRTGQSGMVFYESSMLTRLDENGEIAVLAPAVPQILERFRGKNNITRAL